MGFYHGITVKHKGGYYVLSGPQITFRPAVESTIENAAPTEAEEIASVTPQQPTQTLSSIAAQEAASIAQANPQPADADGESRQIIQIELSADDMALVIELGDNALNDNPLTPEQIFALGLDRAADDNNLFRCENCRGWYSEADAIRQVDDVWLCKECAAAEGLCGCVESTGMPR